MNQTAQFVLEGDSPTLKQIMYPNFLANKSEDYQS